MSPTFDEFAKHVREQVRVVGRTFTEPDADWSPVAIVETPATIAVVGIDPAFLADQESKHLLGEQALPALVRQHKARKLALVMSAWMSVVENRPGLAEALVRGELRPSQDPERIEVVWVVVMDAEVKHAWMAQIRRSRRKPPKLGPWTQPPEGGELAGLMVDSVAEALR